MARRSALFPFVQLLSAALLFDRWFGPPLNRNTAGAAPATPDVVTVNALAAPLAILPSTFTSPPLAPKMIGLEAAPASVLPRPEVKRSSAAPPKALALMLIEPPAPMRVLPVAPAGM